MSHWDYFDKYIRQYLKAHPTGAFNDTIRLIESKRDSDNYYYLLDDLTCALGISFGINAVGSNKYLPYVVFSEHNAFKEDKGTKNWGDQYTWLNAKDAGESLAKFIIDKLIELKTFSSEIENRIKPMTH